MDGPIVTIQANAPTDRPIQLVGTLDITAAADANAVPRFVMKAYSGGRLDLPFGPAVIDLASAKARDTNALPILLSHDANRPIGHATRVAIDATGIAIEGVLSVAGDDRERIVAAAREGFPWRASVGGSGPIRWIREGQSATVNGKKIKGPTAIVERFVLAEVSIVPIPADPRTSLNIAAGRGGNGHEMEFNEWMRARGFNASEMTDQQTETLRAAWRADDGEPGDPVATERARIAAIRASFRGIDQADRVVDELIEAGATIGEAQGRALSMLRSQRSTPARSGGRAVDQPATLAASALVMLGRSDLAEKAHGAAAVEAASRSGIASLADLARACVQATGGHESSTRAYAETAIRASGAGASSISLATILGDSMRRMLLDAYAPSVAGLESWTRPVEVADFREHGLSRLVFGGQLEPVSPTGELTHGKLDEESYKVKVGTFGRIITLTREDIVNDNLGAFAQLPRELGIAAANTANNLCAQALLGNAGNFFATANRNYMQGGESALSVSGLAEAVRMLREQVDADGKPISLTPATLLVPPALEAVAQEVTSSQLVVMAGGDAAEGTAPTTRPAGSWVSRLGIRVVVEPRLGTKAKFPGASDSAWYLVASTAQTAPIALGLLRGQRGPVIESEAADFDTLGMRWRAFFDCAGALHDPRAAVKSKGVA